MAGPSQGLEMNWLPMLVCHPLSILWSYLGHPVECCEDNSGDQYY